VGEQLPGPPSEQQGPVLEDRTDPELVPGDSLGTVRKAQPPFGVPPDPSGSSMMPSRVEKAITMVRFIVCSFSCAVGQMTDRIYLTDV
jgi:hypothetical protein